MTLAIIDVMRITQKENTMLWCMYASKVNSSDYQILSVISLHMPVIAILGTISKCLLSVPLFNYSLYIATTSIRDLSDISCINCTLTALSYGE